MKTLLTDSLPSGVGVGSVKSLTPDQLAENFDYWSSRLRKGQTVSQQSTPSFLLRMPPAHTWGYRLRSQSDSPYKRFLYEIILFQDKALLAKTIRLKGGKPDTSTVGPTARLCGLDEYVFAYLGVHEPRYARDDFPAFGVFIKVSKVLESFPRCIASRRDLDSPERKKQQVPIETHFLLPDHGRKLAELERISDPRHAADPWRYWSAFEYWNKNSWKWKIEFHYHERVGIDDFSAILWPTDPAHFTRMSGKNGETRSNRDVTRFLETYPQCTVIRYELDWSQQGDSLLRASTLAARHYDQKGIFPSRITMGGKVEQ
jgi:hypothetical protein